MDTTLKTDGGTPVKISESIAGHLLWDAMADFRREYEKLTNLCYKLSNDSGGEHSGEEFGGASSYAIPEGKSIGMRSFAARAREVVLAMQDALKRASEFSYGEVYDSLIDRSLLGPEVSENGRHRRLYVDDKRNAPTTFIHSEGTGMHVFMGINPETRSPQPFVIVSTEGMFERYIEPNGEPVLAVSLNDADLYDHEKEGE